jgi:tetratricopeptide (TPR) repeat protein
MLAVAAVVQAQTRPNAASTALISIRGRIYLESSSAPPEGIEVGLERSEMQILSTTFSDSVGNFEFRNLTPGNYYIAIKLSGYEDFRQLVPYTPGNSGPVSVFLSKEPFKVVSVHRESSTVDVTELNRNYPKRALDEYEAAQEDLRKGNNAKAVERLETAIELAPDFYSAHNSLGVAYQKLQRYRDAEKEFNQARELNARSVDPLANLGSLYIQEAEDPKVTNTRRLRGRILDQALDVLEAAIKLNPRSGISFYLLGVANYKSAFYEEAETNLKRALDIDRRMGEAHLMLANLYMRQKKWEGVLENLDAYLAENPQAPDRAQIQEARTKVVHNLETGEK